MDEDLPTVFLNSPIKTRKVKFALYKMPDACEIATRRKINMSLSEKADEILLISKTKESISPESEALIEERIDSIIEKSGESELSELGKELRETSHHFKNTNISPTCPGIHFKEIDLSVLNNFIGEFRVDFLKTAFRTVDLCDDNEINITVNNIIEEAAEKTFDRLLPFLLEDIMCYVTLICSMLLETRARLVLTSTDKRDVLCGLFKKIPQELQTSELVMLFAKKLLALFTHFHNRLFLAECLEQIKCDPLDLDKVPAYFTNRVSRNILHHTLLDIALYKPLDGPESWNSFVHLKKAISKGERIRKLDLYEQYILINILNMLNGMIPINHNDSHKELKAKKWFLKYFSSLRNDKSNKNLINSDFFKIKALCASSNLLWQGQFDVDTSSQVKG